MTNIFSLSFSTGRHVIACYSLGRIISASVVGRCGPKLAERVGNTKEGGSRAVFLRLRGEARGRPRITLTAHSRKKPFFENFTEKYLPIVAGNYAHVVPRYFLKFSSMKFEDTLPREELLFEYTKSVKNGTIFDRTGLDEVEDIFLKRERKKDYSSSRRISFWIYENCQEWN